ncbi:MAG TPA: tetratricopeptide repeat protein [Gemmatimonadales bacterium]|jgi:TolA-binding protein
MNARPVLGVAAALVLAGCATPSQVRGVATQVAVLDREHARADSARAADLVRLQQMQRQSLDSVDLLVGRLNDAIQRMARDNAANFDNLMKQLYTVSNLASNTQSSVRHLNSQIEMNNAAPPPAINSSDSTSPAAATSPSDVARPDVLLEQATAMINSAAYGSARATLNRLISSYPTAPEVGEALYNIGYSFDIGVPPQADSARVYYTRVFTSYPTSVRASTALFKLGVLELKAGNVKAARAAWQMIVDKYPRSDEFDSAQLRLRENP